MTKITLPTMPKIQDIIRLYGLSANQQLSQNFLLDLNITNKICRIAGGFKDCTVIEVGAGPGGLTRSLLTSDAKKVIAVEMDPRFYPALKMLEEASNGKLSVVMGDMMEVNESQILSQYGAEKSDWKDDSKVAIIGNLPFNVGTQLMLKWIRQIAPRKGLYEFGRVPMYLMFQKELSDRAAAKPGTSDYSRLSVMVQHQCEAKSIYELGGKCFVPPPKVSASILRVLPRLEPLGGVSKSDEYLEFICRELFTRKRKLLTNAAELLCSHKQYVPELLDGLGFSINQRVDKLEIKDFVSIANKYVDFPWKCNNIDLLEFKTDGKSIRKEQRVEEKIEQTKKKIQKSQNKISNLEDSNKSNSSQQFLNSMFSNSNTQDSKSFNDIQPRESIAKKISDTLKESIKVGVGKSRYSVENNNKKELEEEEEIDEDDEELEESEIKSRIISKESELQDKYKAKLNLLKRKSEKLKSNSSKNNEDDDYDSFLNK